MHFRFITGNDLKFNQVRAVFPEIERLDIDLPEIQELDPRKVIEAKLESAVAGGVLPVMVEDTSLYFKAMNGLPGPLIKWFLRALGTRGLYECVNQLGDTRVTATTVIGLARNPQDYLFVEASTEGTLVPPRGRELGWNSIFMPVGSNLTFGEMTDEERLTWSMRRAAAERLRDILMQP